MKTYQKQPRIRLHQPQPLPCPTCRGKKGYAVYDSHLATLVLEYTADGKEADAITRLAKRTNRGTMAFCSVCGSKLGFKVIRSEQHHG